jgi:asparagine synthase (glutamine-hydrolysing)
MCGITGYWQASPVNVADASALVTSMAARIAHRGPDDVGVWVDAGNGLALGHRRLAIVDLSEAGHQPMRSTQGRYVIAFNGEIYNHQALRAALDAVAPRVWRGHSDTETLLACIEAWGLKQTLQRATGMFAITLWDHETRTISFARDRLGEKPLYYGWQPGREGALLFGSELKALRAHPNFDANIDPQALTAFLRTGYVPAPWSIHGGIRKLQPGCIAVFSRPDRDPVIETYWSMEEVVRAGLASPLNFGPEEAVDGLEGVLKQAISQQMMADVPLGAFLSGGIDSSTVVALMQAQSTAKVKTFSIGFHEAGFNEADHAKAVAQHLGTDHTELYVTPREAMQVVPRLPALYDEPFADSSQIPTFLVAQLARQHVTVALSGDAGDELFCGYNRYLMTRRLWGKLHWMPRPLRQFVARALRQVPESGWDAFMERISVIVPQSLRQSRFGAKVHKGAQVLGSRSVDDLYLQMVSLWQDPASLVVGGAEPASAITSQSSAFAGIGDVERMMAMDALTYLPDDILAKVDRASMGVSLESRVPMLDHSVVEWAWRLPMEYKLRGNSTKWALRQVLYKHVPRSLVERPKMGFGVPIDAWLRGPLREWAEDLLSTESLRSSGLLHPEPIRHAWQRHRSEVANMQYPLWNILMFQSWFREYATSSAA